MARTVNKVNRNYNKIVRTRKRTIKMNTKTDSRNAIVDVNKRIAARNSGAADLEFESSTIIRRAKLGKNNSIIRPTELSKKKLRKLTHAQKVERTRLIAAGVMDAEMGEGDDDEIDVAPKSKRRSVKNAQLVLEWNSKDASMDEQTSGPVPVGNGTTLGKPGVMF
ncbi:UNVERIFIED_CONTAM: hypothetical protein HDU68_004173 [Siphonaria sp. JEL0065]|nr:hypothetical protein HDU68_004173 [Siphonaria sp. JEL0065]